MLAARNMMIAGGAFNPLSLSPALWLDASDASTLYDATSGGSLVVADGGVARWEDKSGNARHATQVSGGNRPLRKTAIQNGKDVCRFDGSNDLLSIPSVSMFSAGGISVFALRSISAVQTNARIIGQYSANTNSRCWALNSTAWQAQQNAASYNVNQAANYTDSTGLKLISGVFTPTTASVVMTNGSVSGSAATPAASLPTVSEAILIGGSSYPGELYFNCDIAEILVFPTALSTPDRQAVETYLNAKWAIY